MKRTTTFQGAVCVLNSLQNNAAVLKRLQERQDNPGLQLQAMQGFLHRTGITVGELDKLNIVHVTGTKGKHVHGGSMPFYFQLLTLLAFHVFLREREAMGVRDHITWF
eukprot:superscaffoldBa00002508_g14506